MAEQKTIPHAPVWNGPPGPSMASYEIRNKADPAGDPDFDFYKFEHSWNAFSSRPPYNGMGVPASRYSYNAGPISFRRPDQFRLGPGTDRTIATAIYNRLATDAAKARLRHVRVDDNDNYVEEINSGLNNVLKQEANIDQTARAFLVDLVMSMLDEGVVAAVPVETTLNPMVTGSYDVTQLRVARILSWKPEDVQLEVYNDKTGRKEPIYLPKKMVAIIENPFYSVMNENNSVLKRLLRKLQQLDVVDDETTSGKMNMILQLPYNVKSKSRQEQAEQRRLDLENQLVKSKYGIGYIDGTEKITVLNRSIDNNLMDQIKYLTSMLYSQLGITEEIMNGTATEAVMNNYYSRTIGVILDAITDEFERKFLTKTARSQGQAIKYYRDPFSFATADQIAELGDKLTRNEIVSPNEFRAVIGFKPSADQSANELRNRNILPTGYDDQQGEEETPVEDDVDPADQQFVAGLLNEAQNEGIEDEV